jgi:glycosyltransferase involved in cell wall biosynthesis
VLRVAFDATAMPARRAGAGVYTYHLARALAAALPEDVCLHVFDRQGVLDDLGRLPRVTVQRVHLGGRAARAVWEQTLLPRALLRMRARVFHSPHHSLPVPRAGARRVVTVHDVTFRLLPWRYPPARRLYMRAVTALSARRADAVIVPSRATARDLVRLYRVRPERVAVIPEAPPPSMRVVEDGGVLVAARARLRLPARFVLSVGTLEPGKNRDALLRALSLLRARGLPHALVVVGQRGWGGETLAALAHRLGVDDAVVFTGYLPDADLPLVYNLAEAFVFPSWREGFGLPPLEALACGTPVVASDRPALPEVLGDAALYAPPDRPDAIADALERVLTDDRLREGLRSRGLRRAATYSWQRAARETLAVYRSVVG